MGAVQFWLPMLVSLATAAFAGVALRDRRRSERTLHAVRVMVDVVERRSEVTDSSWQTLGADIVVRNDGPSAVTIHSIALAYGPKWAPDDRKPVRWEFDNVSPARLPRRLLAPGDEMSLPAPAEVRSGIGILGPVVVLVDTSGRKWQRTKWGWRQLISQEEAGPRSRDSWFERRNWWPDVDRFLLKRGSRKVLRHPRRVPWEIRLIDLAWGYRPGRDDGSDLPLNAPPTWYYLDLVPPDRWCHPEP